MIFKSESATKTQQNNAKILFGSKGVSILAKLEAYSKEKLLDTAGLDAILDVLKTKNTALLEKFAASKTGKTLASNCKKLASAKTFDAIVKNIKQIKPLKSFDKIKTAPVPTLKSKPVKRVKQSKSSVSPDLRHALKSLGYPYEPTDVNLKNSSPIVIYATRKHIQLGTNSQIFLNLKRDSLSLRLTPKEIVNELNKIPGVICDFYGRAPR